MPVPSRIRRPLNRLQLVPLTALVALGSVACGDYLSTAGPEHCGAVGDEVWGRDLNPHDVTCDVTVTGDLVIGPGTRVRFAPGTALIVQGTLRVEGTADRPVSMESAEEGRGWVGVWVRGWQDGVSVQRPDPDALPASATQGDVVMTHLTIDGAGISPEGGAPFRPAALIVERGPVDLIDVTISDARQCGISMGQEGRLGADSTNLVITGSNEAPICSHAQALGSLPTEGLTLDEGDEIDIFGEQLTGSHTWFDLGHTYRLTEDLQILRGGLTVQAGVNLMLFANTRITVGDSGGGFTYGTKRQVSDRGPLIMAESASLHLAGEAGSPVTFDVEATEGPSSKWDRVRVVGSSSSTVTASALLENVEFRNGGAGVDTEPTTVEAVGDVMVTMANVTISDGGGAGLYLDDGAVLESESRALTITGNAYAVVTHPDGALSLPTDGSSYSGNGNIPSAGPRAGEDLIYLLEGAFQEPGTLSDLGVPYRLDGDLQTAGGRVSDDVNVSLDIADGVQLQVPGNAEVRLGTNSALDLTIGTPGGTGVSMSAVDAAAPWESVSFGPALSSESAVYGLLVEGAGRRGSAAAVTVGASNLRVQGLTIDGTSADEGEETPGLRLSGSFSPDSSGLVVRNAQGPAVWASVDSAASLPKPGVSLNNNGDFNYVYVDGVRVERDGTWSNLGVPYRVPSLVTVSGREDVGGSAFPARLTMEPGVEVLFEPRAGLRTDRYEASDGGTVNGTVVLDGTPEEPIVFRGTNPDAGWSNLHLFYEDDIADPAQRSVLDNLQIIDAGALFAQASLEFWDSTPSVSAITIDEAFRFGVALQTDAFVGPRVTEGEIPYGCDLWATGGLDSQITYGDVGKNIEGGPLPDFQFLDFRVFLSTDPQYCD